ncbi:nucleotide exchange factor GrpE [Streptacidiphilus sp. PB12-B1b]|uniref:nucleotide exchange factor GrpE n=1 Tax=Streptacidiphilus sp. PB12-B1b TaxID=2705012 RepID=UPI0015FE1F20|nr:nucleotide exchange factor GrpE [Streptacidiphilus sp. PB12-B1b]QMU79805.1 nucleotide exchange factor GrpE [Streptacidiphilus sp. PB12-B1b]
MTKETQGFAEEPGAATTGEGKGAADKAAPAPGASEGAATGAGDAAGGAAAGAEELADARKQLAERTADLQRLQAEYQNYRKRVERDRVTVREIAVAALLENLLPVLDDIGRAREHDELTGGFKSVGESLETVVAKLGLQQFGKQGEPFDPQLHEALMHSYSADVEETTCVQILQPGYKIGERIIRPARVAVAEPEPGGSAAGESSDEDAKGDGDSED